jgi:hypothetical protein
LPASVYPVPLDDDIFSSFVLLRELRFIPLVEPDRDIRFALGSEGGEMKKLILSAGLIFAALASGQSGSETATTVRREFGSISYSIHGDRELVKMEKLTQGERDRMAAAEEESAKAQQHVADVEREVKEAHGQSPEDTKALEGFDVEFNGKMALIYHWSLNAEDLENQR